MAEMYNRPIHIYSYSTGICFAPGMGISIFAFMIWLQTSLSQVWWELAGHQLFAMWLEWLLLWCSQVQSNVFCVPDQGTRVWCAGTRFLFTQNITRILVFWFFFWVCTEPINIFHGSYETDLPPIRLSYHRGNHYNSLVDPRNPAVGAGLGFGSLRGVSICIMIILRYLILSMKDVD